MAELEEIINYCRVDGIKHLRTDITPVFENPEAFAEASEYMYQMFEREVFDSIIAVDTNGTVFASSVAAKTKSPLTLVSTKDNLLREMVSEKVETRHGEIFYSVPADSIKAGQKVIIIADTVSHGKDILAAVNLVKRAGGKIVKIGVFLENSDFNARRKYLKGIPLESRIITADL